MYIRLFWFFGLFKTTKSSLNAYELFFFFVAFRNSNTRNPRIPTNYNVVMMMTTNNGQQLQIVK